MIPVLHIDLVEQTATGLQLRMWRDNPNALRTRTLPLSEIGDLVSSAEADYYSPLPAKLQEVGQRLFRWLDGGERWLSTEIRQEENRAQVLVLAIAMPHRLAHLPWEVLHDGTTFLLHAQNPPVLPMRWRNAEGERQPAANRPLQALFMASSPEDVAPVLDYEKEEHDILEATRRWPLDLTVEESGSLDELGALVQEYGSGFFDVLHITGHAGHNGTGTPVFVLEDGEGRRSDASALDLMRKIPHRPPLLFLSGCRTAQSWGKGEVRSLAEQLIENGFRAVLGWGRPVLDTEATLAAQHLYQQLAAGEPLPVALVRTHASLRDNNTRGWHLLRLFCAGDPPAAFVTPVKTVGRKRVLNRPAEREFLDPLTKNVKVATRASFVGRRRLLQRALRGLRSPDVPPVGLLLRGQGGRGKSSIAARLCERLRKDFQRVVVIGRLDESSLINAWVPHLPNDEARRALRDSGTELRFRIEASLRALGDAGHLIPLFVLDDFEQNQSGAADGDLSLALEAAAILIPLFEAIENTGFGRVLITCRYTLPSPFAGAVQSLDVPPLDATEQMKQALRLDQNAPRQTKDADLLKATLEAADGNPRLFEWLHAVLEQPGLDHAGILAEMNRAEERFREQILARRLVEALSVDDRVLLGRLLLLNIPIPIDAVCALAKPRSESELRQSLDQAVSLSLVDVTVEDGEPHFRVPRQLGGDSPLVPIPTDPERSVLTGDVLDVLFGAWWKETYPGDVRALEIIRLAVESGRQEALIAVADGTTTRWLNQDRHLEAQLLLEKIIEPAGRFHGLLLNLAWAIGRLGHTHTAGELLAEAAASCPPDADQARADILFHRVGWLMDRGYLDEAVQICHLELIPIHERLGNTRGHAVVMGKIADVLQSRGELDEALRIRREEELPVYEGVGDVRSLAVTMGQIADVLQARGELGEALRIWREDVLPVYERLGEVRERAVAMGKIADVLQARGELDEALRIRREDVLPVYERLGDVRGRAVTMGKIADVLQSRGELDEVLRIRREEELPVYERLGHVRERAVAMGKIADVLQARGELDEALRIRREDVLPVFERLGEVRERAVTIGKIADVLQSRGELDEVLRIRREEELPVYEGLGDVRSLAVVKGKITDVLQARGELDEALRIRLEDVLPVYQRLGDVRGRAVTMGKIADVLQARGELDEALRIWREDVLPVMERLADMRELIVARVQLAQLLASRGLEQDATEVYEHLVWSYQAAAERGYALVEQIVGIMRHLGLHIPERT